jgi:hypothetical protein
VAQRGMRNAAVVTTSAGGRKTRRAIRIALRQI